MSRAVRFEQYGDSDVLHVETVEDPTPGGGEVLVRVRATSINPGEAKIRDGSLDAMFPATFPSGEGSDVAGVVEALGAGVSGVGEGDEVIGWTDNRAAHAELAVLDVGNVVPKPAGVPWEVAGSLYVAGATAWAMVRAVSAGAGDTVVVAGATGGVGVFAVQLTRLTGARVIGVASERNHEWLRARGVEPVAYGDGVAQRIREAAPEGVDALLDCAGGGYVDLALDELGVAPERVDTIVDFAKVQERGIKADGNAQGARAEVLAELAQRIAAGELEVPIAATYPLDRVADAYDALASGHALGKIVLIP